MNKFLGKKVFFVSYDDIFFEDILEQFFNTALIKPEDLVIVNYEINRNKRKFNTSASFFAVDIDDIDTAKIAQAEMIFFFSLHMWNSLYAEQLLYKFQYPVDNFYIILFDDELERWNKCFEKYGFLNSDVHFKMASHDLKVLQKVKNFIGLNVMKQNISDMLRREVDIFEILYPSLVIEEKYNSFLLDFTHERIKKKKLSEFSILYGTKPQDLESTTSFLISLLKTIWKKNNLRKQITLFIWINPIEIKNYFLWHLLILIKLLARKKGLNLNIKSMYKQPKFNYFIQLLSIDAIILQDRGGFSSAFQYSELGGKILVDAASPNHNYLDFYDIEHVSFKTKRELSETILSEDNYDVNKRDFNGERIKIIRQNRHNNLVIFLTERNLIR